MKISQLKNIIKEALNDLQEQRAMGGRRQIVGNNSTEFINNLVKHFQSTGQKNLAIQAKNLKPVLDNPKHPRRKNGCKNCTAIGQALFCLSGGCVYGEDGKIKWDY